MQLLIREADREDLSEIIQLYGQPDMDHGMVLSIEQAEAIFDRMSAYPNYKLFVAVDNCEIVGTFALAIMDNLAHMGASSGLIEDVMVNPDCQGKGIGRQMMAYAVERCRKYGCYKVALSSHMNREKAHQFYEKLGFKKYGYCFSLDL